MMAHRTAVVKVTQLTVVHDLEGVPMKRDLAYQGDGLDVYVVWDGCEPSQSRWQAVDNAVLHLYAAYCIPASAVRNVRIRKGKKRVSKEMKKAHERTERMF